MDIENPLDELDITSEDRPMYSADDLDELLVESDERPIESEERPIESEDRPKAFEIEQLIIDSAKTDIKSTYFMYIFLTII